MINTAELETPRTAAEILAWVNAAGRRFEATPELRAAARLGRLGAKELWEEARPIALFAHGYFDASPDVTIRHVIGDQNYDATVEDQRANPARVKYIEVTLSDQDYEESLRMELLNRDGHAPGTGPVRAEGPRGNRRVLEGILEAVNHDEQRANHLNRVNEAICRKLGNRYPAETALVVRVADHGPFRYEDDRAELDQVAQDHFVPMVADREFSVLALVGSLGTLLVYQL